MMAGRVVWEKANLLHKGPLPSTRHQILTVCPGPCYNMSRSGKPIPSPLPLTMPTATTTTPPSLTLAREYQPGSIDFPLYASIKIDGIRAVSHGGKLYSRSQKLIPNPGIQQLWPDLPGGLDGELTAGPTFRTTTSLLMSKTLKPSHDLTTVKFTVFDTCHPDHARKPYRERLAYLRSLELPQGVTIAQQQLVDCEAEVADLAAQMIAEGQEGIVVRDRQSPYIPRRTSLVGKIKAAASAEYTIIGVVEGEGKHRGRLGALVVSSLGNTPAITFHVGTGFTDAEREELWASRGDIHGQVVTVDSLPGDSERPRHPRFIKLWGNRREY